MVCQVAYHDYGPYLLVSETSMDDVNKLSGEDSDMKISRFRGNIVIEGIQVPWEEVCVYNMHFKVYMYTLQYIIYRLYLYCV